MIRLAITVEGKTEEEFVKQILTDHLRRRNVESTPILIGRARGNLGGGGGDVSMERLVVDMVHSFHSYDAVTSLVDFYGFRGKENKTVDELEGQVLQEIKTKIPNLDKARVFPYIQKHEFESLLFSDVEAFAEMVDVTNESISALRAILSAFPNPEDINDNPDTAPSKRLKGVISRYRKVVDGLLLAEKIGLVTIRTKCPRFNDWLTRLESLVP